MSHSTYIRRFLSVFIQIWSLCQKVTEVLLFLITIISIKDHTGAFLLIDWGNRSSIQVAIVRPECITGVPNLPLQNTFQFICIGLHYLDSPNQLKYWHYSCLPLYRVLRYIFFCFYSFCCFSASSRGCLFVWRHIVLSFQCILVEEETKTTSGQSRSKVNCNVSAVWSHLFKALLPWTTQQLCRML